MPGSSSSWYYQAFDVIDRVLAALPPDTPAKAGIKAVDDAYPFGERAHWPYKQWLRARRLLLARRFPNDYKPRPSPAAQKDRNGRLF